MEVGLGNTLLAGDPRLVDHIVGEVKSQGIFDQFRKECIADVDTKPAYQNLRTRVEGSVNSFLSKQSWKPDMNKNQLRENLRKHIHEAAYLDAGVERIVDQVVNPKVYSVFMPQIEDVVYKFLGLERPKDHDRNGAKGLKDLLPKDLDPVSPESDKNSLKDISLESVDANTEENCATNNNKHSKSLYNNEPKSQDDESSNEKHSKCDYTHNDQPDNEDNQLESSQKSLNKNVSNSNLNISSKSDDKVEEEEEDSPMFEPIDIMNLNESNISNDSHLSGISELTSHRSRSPDFSNDFSRDNLDFSNQDSQLSKVSSNSRLSIVTDFGSSNHASTPMPEAFKDDSNKGRSKDSSDSKYAKDNFKAIREFESVKSNTKDAKNIIETTKSKDNVQEVKDQKYSKSGLAVKESSRDTTDSRDKDKTESKDPKDKNKDDSAKAKAAKEKTDCKDGRSHKDNKKRQSSHSSTRNDKNDKHSKDKSKEKSDKPRENPDKIRESLDKSKDNSERPKEDKIKDFDKKDSLGKELKDLKDIYKEKIRELREKKELTEKEKLCKDNQDSKVIKDSKVKKESSKDRKDHKKEHRSTSSKSSSRHDDKQSKNEEKSVSKSDGKSSSKTIDSKDSKSESKEKVKRDDKRHSKETKSRTHSERSDKSDVKKDPKNDTQKMDSKKDSRNDSQSKDVEKNERSDTKKDTQGKDRKRKDEKKSKTKDDHSSLRKNPNDRRSTDRDGSNGSNGKSSQKSGASSTACSSKAVSSNLTKESSGTSNSGSETSDNIEGPQSDELNSLPIEPIGQNDELSVEIKPPSTEMIKRNTSDLELCGKTGLSPRKVDLGQTELSLPLKKRPLLTECTAPNPGDFKVKKPKFAKNFYEAKKLMKIRKRLEKQRMREYEAAKEKFQLSSTDNESNSQPAISQATSTSPIVPDEERVQIIEIPDEDYEQPYPEIQTNLTLEEKSIINLESQSSYTNANENTEKQSKLSEMENCIRKSLEEMISDKKLAETNCPTENPIDSTDSVMAVQTEASTKQDDGSQEKQVETTSESLKHEEPAHPIIETIKDVDENPLNALDSANTDEINVSQGQEITNATVDNEKIFENTTEKEDSSNDCKKSKFGDDELDAVVHEKTEKSLKSEEAHHNESEDIGELKISEDNTQVILSSDAIKSTESEGSLEAENSEALKLCKTSVDVVECSEQKETISLHGNAASTKVSTVPTEDQNDCLYFVADDEQYTRFSKFLESIELAEGKTMEDIIECLGGRLVSSSPKTMAPPRPKRKHSTSPLSDILLNNSNNNNDGHKIVESLPVEGSKTAKKRRIGRPKKQRPNANVCTSQNLPNGENFVMPLSPESDVSATSEKTPSQPIKEEKSRQRSSQRYSSDDLYKPRPFFSSSSRRSRRSNQA